MPPGGRHGVSRQVEKNLRSSADDTSNSLRHHHRFIDNFAVIDEVDEFVPNLVACAVKPAYQFDAVTQVRHRPLHEVLATQNIFAS